MITKNISPAVRERLDKLWLKYDVQRRNGDVEHTRTRDHIEEAVYQLGYTEGKTPSVGR